MENVTFSKILPTFGYKDSYFSSNGQEKYDKIYEKKKIMFFFG